MPEAKLDVIVDPSGAISGATQAKQAINSMRESSKSTVKEMERIGLANQRIDQAAKKLVTTIKSAGSAWLIYKAIMNTYISNSIEAERVETQLNAVLRSTQHAAGLTAIELKNMASEMQMLTAFGDEEVLSMQNILLTFKNIKGDAFRQTTMAVLDLSTAMGMDLKSAAIQVGKALNDPKTGLTMLQRVGITFSESQKKVIKDLVQTGKVAEAQKVILKELESQFGGSAKAATNSFGGALAQLKNKFGDLFEINATGEFGEMTTAVKELTTALDTEPVKEFAQELGKLIANGIEEATNALKTMAENVDTVKAAIVGLSGLKLSKAVLAFLGLSGGTAGAISVGIGGIAFGAFKNKQLADERLKDIRLLESAGEIPLGSLGKGYTGKQLKEMVSGLSSSEWASNSLGAIRALEGTNLGKISKLKPTPYSDGGGGSSKKGKSEIDLLIQSIQDRMKYLGEDGNKFLVVLDKWQAKLKPLSEDWKKVTDLKLDIQSDNAQKAGKEMSALFTRMEEQKKLIEEAKSAATEGEQKYYDSLRWENQEGLLGDSEYLDVLKKRFADLSTELEGLGIDMQNVSNWSEPMRATFSEMQSVVGTLASDQMELLRGQFENGVLTSAQYLSALTAIKDQFAKYPAIVKMADQAIAAFNAAAQSKLPTVAGQVQQAWDDMQMSIAQVPDAMGNAFMEAIKGSKSLGDALNSLLADIGAVIAKALIMKYLVGPIMGFMGFADGGVFQGGQLTAFASGGVVNKPTLFPFASGVGLMGEAGPEAIMPLERGTDGKLGVKNNAGGGQPVIINVLDKGDLEQVTYEAMAKYPGSQIVTNHVLRQRVERGSLAFGGAVR